MKVAVAVGVHVGVCVHVGVGVRVGVAVSGGRGVSVGVMVGVGVGVQIMLFVERQMSSLRGAVSSSALYVHVSSSTTICCSSEMVKVAVIT